MKSNWNYPTTVWVGNNRIIEINSACKNLKIKKPLFVTDKDLIGLDFVKNIIKIILKEGFNLETVIFSIDDFYKTFKERKLMAKKISSLFLTRGVPGTHDTRMLHSCIKNLKNTKFKISI